MKQKTVRNAVLAAIAGVLITGTGATWAGVEEAEANFDKQEYFHAYREAIEPAKKGDAAAQAMIGRIYFLGTGAPRDHFAAFSWYRKAAEQGHASAQFELARFYQNGNGTKPDPVMAAQWMEKSASQGVVWAMLAAGKMYRDGTGVAADPAKAFQWLSLAASAKETPATAESIKLARQAVTELQPKLEAAQLASAQKQVATWEASKAPRDTLWARAVNAPLPTVIRKAAEAEKPEAPQPGSSPLAKDFFPKH